MEFIILGAILIAAGYLINNKIQQLNNLPVKPLLTLIGAAAVGWGVFTGAFFYAEPGYKYHVRTITGNESMVKDVGYNIYLFGRYNAWKNAMTVQATKEGSGTVVAEEESASTSANLGPQTLVFLDQVDAEVTATARFLLPDDETSFLLLARQFRSPENLLRTELIPAFQETLGSTASLLSAEEYFSGGRTQFNTEFQNQMEQGIYNVRRRETMQRVSRSQTSSANASLGMDQQDFGDDQQVVFVVEKILDANGQPLRKSQNFSKFGISVVSARITDVNPNSRFRERMEQKQAAAAARAVAREQRVQEEEQRLLAITRGEREVAERQAQAKVIQIEQTTQAETEKQLVITQARQRNEQAEIERQTALINLERAKVDAESKRVAADAAAYEKRAILEADNALQQKLEAYVEAQKFWADAFAKRNVPTQVFGANQSGVGQDSDIQTFMDIMTMKAAKDLSFDPSIESIGN